MSHGFANVAERIERMLGTVGIAKLHGHLGRRTMDNNRYVHSLHAGSRVHRLILSGNGLKNPGQEMLVLLIKDEHKVPDRTQVGLDASRAKAKKQRSKLCSKLRHLLFSSLHCHRLQRHLRQWAQRRLLQPRL